MVSLSLMKKGPVEAGPFFPILIRITLQDSYGIPIGGCATGSKVLE